MAKALAERSLAQNPLLLVGIALLAGGLAFKIAAVPFHAWAPDAYQGACAPVAAFLAAGSKAAGLAELGRVSLVAFAPEQHIWSVILVGLAALSMGIASLLAVTQSDMKRLLAYSSIAHAGYALLGLISGTPDGASATMTYAFVYAFMTHVVETHRRAASHGPRAPLPITKSPKSRFRLRVAVSAGKQRADARVIGESREHVGRSSDASKTARAHHARLRARGC